jgi:hypothetical protein
MSNSGFVTAFNCKNEAHVLWLKKIGAEMTRAVNGEKVDIIKTIESNPLDNVPKMTNPADFAYIHFQLSMKYANAVLNNDAFIPQKE